METEDLQRDDDFEDRVFEGLQLVSAEAGGFPLTGKTFDSCRFVNCQFDGTRLDGSNFRDCSFSGCRLTVVSLRKTRFRQVAFVDCRIGGIDWSGIELGNPGMSFEDCMLDSCSFFKQKLAGLVFSACRLVACDFTECDLSRAAFGACVFSDGGFSKCNLRDADFVSAEGYSIDPASNQLRGARFRFPEALSLLKYLGIKLE